MTCRIIKFPKQTMPIPPAEGIAKLALNIRQAADVFLDHECPDQAQSFINAAEWIEKVAREMRRR